jgi:alpha-mannosidase
MNSIRHLFTLILIVFSLPANAQQAAPVFGYQHFINGYAKAVTGETMAYFSVYPHYAKEALLTRCTDGKKIIEWETDVIPASSTGDHVYFTWIAAHSTGTNSGVRNFDLYINDRFSLSFTTYQNNYPRYWTFGGNDSTRLVFEFMTRDGASDAHGMAYLRVPATKVQRGKPLKLKVVGQHQNSNDWWMTFMYSFREKIDIEPLPFILRGGANNKQPLKFTVLHFGGREKVSIHIDQGIAKEFVAENGFNVFEVPVNLAKTKTVLRVRASIGKIYSTDTVVTLKPIVHREINLIHHSHTDIGYSHIQEDVIKIHNQNIRNALHLIRKTKNYPEGSRFKWNIESAWAVENFLEFASEKEKKDFFRAVKNKQIAISATYANIMTGLCTPEEMHWISEYAAGLRDKFKLPVHTAMMTDIPGMSGSMIPALAKNGVRYFSNGPNYVESLPDKGDRVGHTMREQGNKAFWWKSSSGKDSILFWTCGKGYSSWHGVPQGGVADRGPEKIAAYMNELDALNYPYSIVHWRYNIVADNGPTDSTLPDFVKSWNKKYVWPKLLLANVTDMFGRFEMIYGKKIPVLSGDFTPYWEDGAYSTAKEETNVRMLSERLTLLIDLANQKKKSLNRDWLYQAKKNIVMFHEHTWGSWNSISTPDVVFTTHQWEYKKRFADSAAFYIDRLESGLIKNDPDPSQIAVTNTLSWNRSGLVELNCPDSFKWNAVMDEKGNKQALQKTADGKICFIAKDIPANGEKKYRLLLVNGVLNDFNASVSFVTDSSTGAVSHLNVLNRNWVAKSPFKMLQALYVAGLDPKKFSTSSLKKMDWIEDGAVLKKLKMVCDLEGANELSYEINQYSGMNTVKLSVIIDKKAIREKESVHIALPFSVNDPETRIGMDNSFITPEHFRIPGSNHDFFSVQRWIDVSNKEIGVTIASPQGALFELGEMINEEKLVNGTKKWKDAARSSSLLFLYAMNNYWHTNFKIDQDGKTRFDLYLNFHGPFDLVPATRFGYEMTQPLTGVLVK